MIVPRLYMVIVHLFIVILFIMVITKPYNSCIPTSSTSSNPIYPSDINEGVGIVHVGLGILNKTIGGWYRGIGYEGHDPSITQTFFDNEIQCFKGVSGNTTRTQCPFNSQFFEGQEFVKWYMDQWRLSTSDSTQTRWPLYGPNYTVLEMGGMDGLSYSNSLFFEKQLGWRSYNIEPSRISFPLLMKNRPNSINLRLAGCLEDKIVSFTERKEDTAVSHLSSIKEGGPGESYDVQCGPISKYLRVIGVSRIDLFYLDVEGAELDVLKTFNFNDIKVHYLIIEFQKLYDINDSHTKIRDLLSEQGFSYISKWGWGDKNEFYVNHGY